MKTIKTNVVSFAAARKKRLTKAIEKDVSKIEKGSANLSSELSKYALARVQKNYAKLMRLTEVSEGLRIPYWSIDGKRLKFARIRLFPPRGGQKFSQPYGTRNRFYLSPPLGGGATWKEIAADRENIVYIVEKEFGAAALAQHKLAAIGLGGVWSWLTRNDSNESVPVPDFDLFVWKDRTVVLVFDADARTNQNIQIALIRLAAELRRRGATVLVKIIPNLGDGKTGADDYIAKEGIKQFRLLPEKELSDPEFDSWGLAREPKCTDTGNSTRFVLQHAERVRYAHEWKAWLLWTGSRWQRDATEAVWELARRTVRSIYREAQESTDSERRKNLGIWAIASEAVGRIESMLRSARTEKAVAVSVTQLDTHPMLLAVANGVVDLNEGKLRQSDPAYLLTKQSPVVYDEAAQCPTFERFIFEICDDDEELAKYLQRVIGYLLTGDTSEQCFFVFYGIGANGKSTLLRILVELLGDFASSTRMESWTAQKRNAGGPSEDFARLHGARMASAVESEEDTRLAESAIKELTGQDRVNARRLYENSFEYIPQFKLILVCNHKPAIRADDPAIWRRVRLVPFEKVFAKKTQDKHLVEKLRAELPGILNWAIAGCLEWKRKGLKEPKKILTATSQYRNDNDILKSFLSESVDDGEAYTVRAGQLYRAYCGWIEENGHRPLSATKLRQRMADKGYGHTRDKHGALYRGLRLRVGGRK